jgi:hypothetical protein
MSMKNEIMAQWRISWRLLKMKIMRKPSIAWRSIEMWRKAQNQRRKWRSHGVSSIPKCGGKGEWPYEMRNESGK